MYDGYRPLDPPRWWIRLFDGPLQHASEDGLNDDDETTAHEEIEGVRLGRSDLATAPAPDVQ